MFLVDIIAVKVVGGHVLELEFEDGLIGTVDIRQIVGEFEGVFAPLLNPEFFRKVAVDPEIGTIVWPNGADICPDVLYSFASGKPIVVDGKQVMN